jgi:hypothetical protein
MQKRYYVIDEDDEMSYSAKKESTEHFTSKRAAQKRAVAMANLNPGKLFFIAETIQFADAEVTPATYKTI